MATVLDQFEPHMIPENHPAAVRPLRESSVSSGNIPEHGGTMPLQKNEVDQVHPLVHKKLLDLLGYLQLGADYHPIEMVQDICDLLHVDCEQSMPTARSFSVKKVVQGRDVCVQIDPTELDGTNYCSSEDAPVDIDEEESELEVDDDNDDEVEDDQYPVPANQSPARQRGDPAVPADVPYLQTGSSLACLQVGSAGGERRCSTPRQGITPRQALTPRQPTTPRTPRSGFTSPCKPAPTLPSPRNYGNASPSAGYWKQSSALSNAERALHDMERDALVAREHVAYLEHICADLELSINTMWGKAMSRHQPSPEAPSFMYLPSPEVEEAHAAPKALPSPNAIPSPSSPAKPTRRSIVVVDGPSTTNDREHSPTLLPFVIPTIPKLMTEAARQPEASSSTVNGSSSCTGPAHSNASRAPDMCSRAHGGAASAPDTSSRGVDQPSEKSSSKGERHRRRASKFASPPTPPLHGATCQGEFESLFGSGFASPRVCAAQPPASPDLMQQSPSLLSKKRPAAPPAIVSEAKPDPAAAVSAPADDEPHDVRSWVTKTVLGSEYAVAGGTAVLAVEQSSPKAEDFVDVGTSPQTPLGKAAGEPRGGRPPSVPRLNVKIWTF
mmetsp:Transcript_19331/g.47441  ORF Transcript_19331/g.47441 Transcript_19331/m.47441 type:complete len:611 (-) Transcript_19331:274-2106(-)